MDRKIGREDRCTVIGYGSWATALVKMLLENEQQVGWYVSNPNVMEGIRSRGRNIRYLRDVEFPVDRLLLYDNIDEAVAGTDIVILAVPSAFLGNALSPLTYPLKDKFVLSAIKGIVPEENAPVSEYLNRRYRVPFERIGVVTGPCHSEEVALKRLSYLTLVSKDMDNARTLCDKFASDYIHANPSTDLGGAEFAAVFKNIYAICAGIAIGLGYGDNFMAVLISNCAMEMEKFLNAKRGYSHNILASAYTGDLLVTCYSQFSRNRMFGTMIGKGYSIDSAMTEMNMVAEGYYACGFVEQVKSGTGIEMPIAECVYRILYQNAPASEQMRELTAKLI